MNDNLEILGWESMRWLGGIYSLPTTSSCWLISAGDGHAGQSGAPPDSNYALSGTCHISATVRVRSWSTVGAFVVLMHQTVQCHLNLFIGLC
jgi:hypothetical protein